MVNTFTYTPSLVKIDYTILSYRGYRPRNKQTNTPTNTHTNPQTGPIAIHCAAASLARSVITPIFYKFSLKIAHLLLVL